MSVIKWGLSVLDWRSHAIDERRYHPVGVFKAECGHLLMMLVELHERPNGKACETCATKKLALAMAALERAQAGLRSVVWPPALPARPRRDD